MTIFLDGIAAQFYRGIGDDTQYITPFSRLNFFIGANNAGKSIVLNLLASRLAQVTSGKTPSPLGGPEVYRGRTTGNFMMAVGRNIEDVSEVVAEEYSMNGFSYQSRNHHLSGLPTLATETQRILEKQSIAGNVWVISDGRRAVSLQPSVDLDEAANWTQEWRGVWQALTRQSGGSLKQHWIPETLNVLASKALPSLPPIHMVPAKRILGGKEEAFEDLTGKGLIDHLATLQNPAWNRQEDREKFRRINRFLQEVIGKRDATLEIPSAREHLLVHMDNKVLPLSSLGTGIHEVVLIASFCTIHDGSIMCLEEPEIHLHPLLQRKLVNYLVENTSSQYFIATHSSAFIDTADANVFHVANDGEQTRVKPVLTRQEQRGILDDLGSQASDILQANAVIWVEGPSDRIYLNHWIAKTDDRLREGIHYTIMFYGGALIRHLTASDDALEEFIKLRDLNRNMAVIIDSDRETASSPLKPHAERLLKEMNAGGGLAWVTAGREIENYVDGAKLQDAMRELHPKLYKGPCKLGPFDHAFYFMRENPKNKGKRITYKEGDKVGAATRVCAGEAKLDILDLKERIEELAAMIRKANGLLEK